MNIERDEYLNWGEDLDKVIERNIGHVGRTILVKFRNKCWFDLIKWMGCAWREKIGNTVARNTMFVDFKGISFRNIKGGILDYPKGATIAWLIDSNLNVYGLTVYKRLHLLLDKLPCAKCGATVKFLSDVMICEHCGEIVNNGVE